MGDYTAPPAPATCESVVADVTTDVSADVSADVPVAYDRDLDGDICLDVDLTDSDDELVDLDVDASLE